MSGHSKWKTIQHKKGAADAKRGKIFSRISKELTVTARMGGGNPEMNPTLRTVVQTARAANMPMDNITRAIKKGTGELDGGTFDEIIYEGYASGGVGLVVKVLTDNRNRAAAEIRHIFTKNGSSFAQQGAVSRSFHRKGQVLIEGDAIAEDDLMELVLEAGAEDMTSEDGRYEVLTDPLAFNDVVTAIREKGIEPDTAELSLIPETLVPVNDEKTARAILRFMNELEDNEDVQDVYANFDISDELMNAVNE
ncbi:MAG: YebC/PmpR family DNA-binding transcriptional regulator [Verrucomicrobia bacterium]|nr:YebC/PmpR family DNA-binding transcriptional regulator [Verrucomicrobiota bacterium]MDA1087469.1 YebC/PmpR family DNA-binding transcriptional regulator [Verrucomicrobiota bacterium]